MKHRKEINKLSLRSFDSFLEWKSDEELSSLLAKEIFPGSSSELELEFKKIHHPEFTQILLVKGNFEATLKEHCVKCLTPLKSQIDLPLNMAFIAEQYIGDSFWEETLEYPFENHLFEIFYRGQREKVDLKDAISQTIEENRNPYPLHSSDCKGLCSTCGVDLNQTICSHHCKEPLN